MLSYNLFEQYHDHVYIIANNEIIYIKSNLKKLKKQISKIGKVPWVWKMDKNKCPFFNRPGILRKKGVLFSLMVSMVWLAKKIILTL